MIVLIRPYAFVMALSLLAAAGAAAQTAPAGQQSAQSPAPPPAQAAPAPGMPRKATLGEKATARKSPAPKTLMAPKTSRSGRELVTIPLTHIGVADPRFLNARNPPNVLTLPANWHQRVSDARQRANEAHFAAAKARADLQNARDADAARLQVVVADAIAAAKAADDAVQTLFDEFVALADPVDLGFQNNTSEQRLVVSFKAYVPTVVKSSNQTLAGVRRGMQEQLNDLFEKRQTQNRSIGSSIHVGDCKSGGDVTCDATITIDPGQMGIVPVTLMARMGSFDDLTSTPISFKVDFFAENATPAHPTGYFCIVPAEDLVEIDSAAAWSTKASVSYEATPHLDDDAILAAATPYQFSTDRDFPASGVLTFDANLGGRATASVDLAFKTATLDGTDAGAVSSPRFQVDVHAIKPITLSFGHFDFATPSNSISVNEKGEGFQLAYQNFSVAAIFNPDGGPRLPKQDERHDKEVLLQFANIQVAPASHWESLNLFAVFGRASYVVTPVATPSDGSTETPPPDPSAPVLADGLAHQYGSVGAETFFTFVQDRIRASLSGYFNARAATHQSGLGSAQGYTLDSTATYTTFGDVGPDNLRTINFILSAEAAVGRRYAGEHSGFAPDTQFLSGFATKIDPESGLGVGMADKRYYSAGVTVKHDSPLYWLARGIGVPDSDIASNSSAFTWHHFDSTAGPFKGVLSNEYDGEIDVETPAKVTSSITVSYFRPEGQLKTVLGGRSAFWTFTANLVVKM
jgi:hypothetical protein